MMRAIVVALLVAATAVAGGPPEFHYARPVTPGAAGPNALVVDVPLLSGARPLRFDATGRFGGGLEDLRLFGADGDEVPYLVVAPPSVERRWQSGRLQPIVSTKEASGFEVDLGEVVRADRLRLTGLPGPLLKRVRLEGSGDRQHWVVLAPDTTVFDLPEEGLRRMEIGFEASPVRHLRVTWDDRSSAPVPLPAAVSVAIAATIAPSPVLVPLVFERRASEPGTSRFRIRLPGPGLPIRAFELDCGGEHLLRGARVNEPQLTGEAVTPRQLGTGVLRRVTRADAVASDLRVAVATPHELEVELVVDDADNPPLELQAVRAELPALPSLYFESRDGAALVTKFGAPDLAAPRYDLEAARGALREAEAAPATWGERASLPVSPPADAEDVQEGIATVGAPIDVSVFRYMRAIPPGPPGLTALRLDAAALAHSRGGDVRLVDATGRQIPYVVEHLGEPLVVALPAPTVEPASTRPDSARVTTYRVQLPYRRLPGARLVLETTERVFERHVVVRDERRPRDPRSHEHSATLRTATWRHADPRRPPPALTIELPPVDATSVLIDVDDGDNSPLPVRSARLLLATRRLRFVRTSAAEPSLAYGAASLAAPRYDLTLLAPRILGAPAHETDPLAEPAGVADTDAADEHPDVVGRRVFWVVLGGAVLVLLVVLARLLRVEERTGAA